MGHSAHPYDFVQLARTTSITATLGTSGWNQQLHATSGIELASLQFTAHLSRSHAHVPFLSRPAKNHPDRGTTPWKGNDHCRHYRTQAGMGRLSCRALPQARLRSHSRLYSTGVASLMLFESAYKTDHGVH